MGGGGGGRAKRCVVCVIKRGGEGARGELNAGCVERVYMGLLAEE